MLKKQKQSRSIITALQTAASIQFPSQVLREELGDKFGTLMALADLLGNTMVYAEIHKETIAEVRHENISWSTIEQSIIISSHLGQQRTSSDDSSGHNVGVHHNDEERQQHARKINRLTKWNNIQLSQIRKINVSKLQDQLTLCRDAISDAYGET